MMYIETIESNQEFLNTSILPRSKFSPFYIIHDRMSGSFLSFDHVRKCLIFDIKDHQLHSKVTLKRVLCTVNSPKDGAESVRWPESSGSPPYLF